MNLAILGSGAVGQILGGKLAALGHTVVLGTRTPEDLDSKRGFGNPLREWLAEAGENGRLDLFDAAAAHGEVVINATSGTGALKALELAGRENLAGKILIDVSNPLDFSQGFPPTLTVCNTDSLGEQIQGAYPDVRVVKTLNTVTAKLMVDPSLVNGGDHSIFVSGNDADAKATVTGFLRDWFGWREVIDLGDITSARGAEMLLPLWVRLMGVFGTGAFNFKVVK